MNFNYSKVWDNIAEKFAKDNVLSKINPEHKKIFKMGLKRGNVLDVGCANGKHLLYLAKKGFTTLGIDISTEMINQAKQLFKENNLKSYLIGGSASTLPFRDNYFDNVICMGNSIGSIPGNKNRVKAIKEIIGVAKYNIIFELLKSTTTKEVKAKYWFSEQMYLAKRWNENEISRLLSEIKKKFNFDFRIIKGRRSLVEKYLFYVLIKKTT